MKKITTGIAALATALSLSACSSPAPAESATPTTAPENTAAATEAPAASASVKVAVVYGAAHGEKCFSSAAVVVDGETGAIVDAFVDEYQYMDPTQEGVVAVPNSDGAFNEGAVEGKALVSKKQSNSAYSANMAEKAGATQEYAVNMKAIEDFAKGKTGDELAGVDTVSGATFADTAGYVALIAEGAKAAAASEKAYEVSSLDDVALVESLAAAHGDKCFTLVDVVVEGDTVVTARVDEFQYMSADQEGVVAVPNSEAGFGENYAEGKVLVSKKQSNTAYSANMAEKAGATQEYAVNMEAIEDFVSGKTVSELSGVDAVSGATFADTANYVAAIADAVASHK